VSSRKIHQLVFGLPTGGSFKHSAEYRTVFAADEVLYVLEGTMVIANPETGEVHRVSTGEAAFFRRDTWHHAFAHGGEPLRVLELFAPPPSAGTSGAYARTKPLLTDARYSQEELLERWPEAQEEALRDHTIRVLHDKDVLWRLEGRERQILVGILASTEHLTVGKLLLSPGETTDIESHGGDESLYVLAGTVHVRLSGHDGQGWHELGAGDGFYLPEGTPHQYSNVSGRPVELVFGVAPTYGGGRPDMREVP
jgi:quercetin dioxygenase-like cupin family protein